MIIKMCTDNAKMTKKVASCILKSFQNCNYADPPKNAFHLASLAQFLKIDDTLKRARMEWIFGVPEINVQKNYSSQSQSYQIQL